MGKLANKDEIYFNYPIPRAVHRQVKQLQLDTGMSVKDIVINSLVKYISDYRKQEEIEDGEDL